MGIHGNETCVPCGLCMATGPESGTCISAQCSFVRCKLQNSKSVCFHEVNDPLQSDCPCDCEHGYDDDSLAGQHRCRTGQHNSSFSRLPEHHPWPMCCRRYMLFWKWVVLSHDPFICKVTKQCASSMELSCFPTDSVDLNSGYRSWPQPEVWGTCRKKRCGGPRADIFNVTCDRSKDPPFAVDWLVKHFGSEAWQ